MSDGIMLVFGEDGVAREYDDTWDITIHCESEEEQKAVWEKLNNLNREVKNLTDTISRQAAIDIFDDYNVSVENGELEAYSRDRKRLCELPSAQPELCEYYALCRHGRDENKLRADLGVCDYCHEDSDGYVRPVEKNCHAFIRFGMDGWELSLKANGWHGSAKIRYCPMCGRELKT